MELNIPLHNSLCKDENLTRLLIRHKATGYGIYFLLLERLASAKNLMCAKDYELIAYDLREDATLIKSVIEDFGLFAFTEDEKFFYSEMLLGQAKMKADISKRRSEAGKKGLQSRWQKNSKDEKESIAIATKNIANAINPIAIATKNIANAINPIAIATKNIANAINEKENEKEIKKEKENVPPIPPLKEKEINKEKEKENSTNVGLRLASQSPQLKAKEENLEVVFGAGAVEGEVKAQKPKTIIHKARQLFEARYKDLTKGELYYWQAKDAVSMKQLLDKIRFSRGNRGKPIDDDSLLAALKAFLLSIDDGWTLSHFTVGIIASQYNSIVSQYITKQQNKNETIKDRRRGWDVDTSLSANDYEEQF